MVHSEPIFSFTNQFVPKLIDSAVSDRSGMLNCKSLILHQLAKIRCKLRKEKAHLSSHFMAPFFTINIMRKANCCHYILLPVSTNTTSSRGQENMKATASPITSS